MMQLTGTGDVYNPATFTFDDDTKQRIEMARQMGTMSEEEINAKAIEYQARKQVSQPKEYGRQTSADGVADWLPTIGAVAGSFVPGLGTIAGGALGAGVGTLLKQSAKGEKTDVGEVAKEAAIAGAGGLIFKGVGKVAGKLLPKIGGVVEKAGTGVRGGVAKIYTKGSIYGAAEEAAIKKTLEQLGIKGGSEAQYATLQPVMQKLEQEIAVKLPTLMDKPVSTSILKESFGQNLKSNLLSKSLTSSQAKSEVAGFMKDLMKMSGKSGNFANIDPKTLLDWKRLINESYEPIANKLAGGGALTPREQVVNVAWKTIDDTLSKNYPQIKEILTKQSHLYKAAQSLNVSRKTIPTNRFMGTTVPKGISEGVTDFSGRVLQGAGRKISNLPGIPSLTRAGVVGGAIVGDQGGQSIENPESDYYQSINQVTQGDNGNGQQGQADNEVQHQDDYITGYSPKKLLTAYMEAQQAGDKASASMLKGWFEIETEYQKNAKPKETKLSAVQQVNKFNSESGLRALSTLESEMQKNPNVIYQASIPGSPGARIFNSARKEASDVITRLRTGAALTAAEEKFYASQLPQPLDSAETIAYKIGVFRQLFNNIASGQTSPASDVTTLPAITE